MEETPRAARVATLAEDNADREDYVDDEDEDDDDLRAHAHDELRLPEVARCNRENYLFPQFCKIAARFATLTVRSDFRDGVNDCERQKNRAHSTSHHRHDLKRAAETTLKSVAENLLNVT